MTSADGSKRETQLSPAGEYAVQGISGALPVKAKVVLDSSRIAVRPGSTLGRPYELALGDAVELKAGQPRSKGELVVVGNAAAGSARNAAPGAANIFAVLDRGAKVSQAASPISIPKLTARWRYFNDLTTWIADHTPSQYDDNAPLSAAQMLVGGRQNGSFHDEWEEFVLLHEYAHHVHRVLADPGNTKNSDHTYQGVYPNDPVLPWTEGFADAFYGAVTGNPRPTLGCAPAAQAKGEKKGTPIDWSSEPATPDPDTTQLAQYNETAIAGVLWHLMGHFGGNNVTAGLTPLLGALHRYRRNGLPPQTIRDVRDALIVAGLEHTRTDHSDIDKIFAAQRIAWGFYVSLAHTDSRAEGSRANHYVSLYLSGPGGYGSNCVDDFDTTSEISYGPNSTRPFSWGAGLIFPGDLSTYTWQSDCLMSVGSFTNGGGPTYDLNAEFWLRFPYLADQRHLPEQSNRKAQNFTLSVRYECSPSGSPPTPQEACTPNRKYQLRVDNGVWGNTDSEFGPAYTALYGAQDWVRAQALGGMRTDVTLTPGMNVILKFNAEGNCTIVQLPEAISCST